MLTIYACLDDRDGMLFNKRRQSRDAAVLEDIRTGLPGSLTILPFSEKLIRAAEIPCSIVQQEPAPDSQELHFFAEAPVSPELLQEAGMLVIYRWNRHYPADTRWEGAPAEYGFQLTQTTEFPGRSHETITKEVYTK